MRLDVSKLSSSVRLALSLGAVATAGSVTAIAQDTGAPQKNQSLETIVVTGSNIRRVDIETASPVVTIDRAQIQASGKVNLGDLIQELPSMAGAAMNPQVNNGGAGTAGVSLRGLGSNRTLMLINGHRIPFQLQDLNLLPVSIVERIEVLNDGASAVYGSDAIAGVVNIITRANYQGAEFGVDYGQADRDDGTRKAVHAIFGQTSDKGSIVFGMQYDKQDPVSAANRNVSKSAQYLYNVGANSHAGSSRTPGGRFFIPATSPVAKALGCPVSNGITSVTLSGSQLPGQTTPPGAGDFRCYNPSTDGFNFQAVGNYNLVPNERTGVFALGNYKLTDNVEAYAELLYHKTVTHLQLAPYPFDLTSNGLVIPADQYYNPFGVEFGNNGSSSTIALRLSSIGDRGTKLSNTTELGNVGLKGNIGDSSWNWDAHFSYGKLTLETQLLNYINISQLAPDFGCTTAPGAGNCTPIDIFNQNDPNTLALLQAAKINPFLSTLYQTKEFDASANGTLFSLPAGDVALAVGGSYRKEYLNGQVDPLINTTYDTGPDGEPTLSCPGPNSICSSAAQGGYNLKEAYAELLVPLLKDAPFAHSLNIDIGDRYSKYSNFGSTNNWKVAIEYRPIEDLLLRGTVSKVFRAPTPTNLYAGPFTDAPNATDPCAGTNGNPNKACGGFNVPPQIFSQLTGFVMGSQFAAAHGLSTAVLQPEFGKSFDYGLVYDPEWIPGLSVNADYYRILLNNLIVSGPGIAQTILTDCYNTQGPICSNIVRASDGSIKFVIETPFNAGNLVDQGLDVGVHYRLPTTQWGNFRVGVDGTYIQNYNVSEPGFTQHLAGHFDKTFGNFARLRGLATLDWNLGPWTANWTTRYIGRITLGYANQCLGPSAADGDTADGSNQCDNYIGEDNGFAVQHYGAVTYHNMSVGYNIEPINTFVQIGVDNIFDKQPPMMYLNNVLNANTDVSTYDLVGRFYRASMTVKF